MTGTNVMFCFRLSSFSETDDPGMLWKFSGNRFVLLNAINSDNIINEMMRKYSFLTANNYKYRLKTNSVLFII